MESFHSLLQGNVLGRQTWDTGDQLRQAIVTWIETKYHRIWATLRKWNRFIDFFRRLVSSKA